MKDPTHFKPAVGWLEKRRQTKAFHAAYLADDLEAALAAIDAGGLGPALHKLKFEVVTITGSKCFKYKGDAMDSAISERRWRWIAPLCDKAPQLALPGESESLQLAFKSLVFNADTALAPSECEAAQLFLKWTSIVSKPKNDPFFLPEMAQIHEDKSRFKTSLAILGMRGDQGAELSSLKSQRPTAFGHAALLGRSDLLAVFASHAASHMFLPCNPSEALQELFERASALSSDETNQLRSALRPHSPLAYFQQAADVSAELLDKNGSRQFQLCLDVVKPMLDKLKAFPVDPTAADSSLSSSADAIPMGPSAGALPMDQAAFQQLLLLEIAKLGKQVSELRAEAQQLRSSALAPSSSPSKIASWRWGRKNSDPGSPDDSPAHGRR